MTTGTPAPAQVVVATPAATPAAQPTNTIIVTQAPPAQTVPEAVIAQPSPQHAWVPGYYTWRNNRYEWMAGHWEIPPRAGATWVASRYEREGTGYRFYERLLELVFAIGFFNQGVDANGVG